MKQKENPKEGNNAVAEDGARYRAEAQRGAGTTSQGSARLERARGGVSQLRQHPRRIRDTLAKILNFPAIASPELRERRQLKAEVSALLKEAGQPNWDGEGADPLDARTVEMAHEFIDLLPDYLDDPGVYPTPHGRICLDWILSRKVMLGVSLHFEDTIAFAALFDGEEMGGSEPWKHKIPDTMTACFEKLHALGG